MTQQSCDLILAVRSFLEDVILHKECFQNRFLPFPLTLCRHYSLFAVILVHIRQRNNSSQVLSVTESGVYGWDYYPTKVLPLGMVKGRHTEFTSPMPLCNVLASYPGSSQRFNIAREKRTYLVTDMAGGTNLTWFHLD